MEGDTLGARQDRSHSRPDTLSSDVEDRADAEVEPAQHRAQLRLQVEAHQLAEKRVVTGGMSCKLVKKHTLRFIPYS